MVNLPKIIVIVGPTASGKSALAVTVAKEFDGEVVSADSRQIYRGLDIGTGKVTSEEMDGIPHHMLDIASAKKRFSVSEYKRKAQKAITGILQRNKIPIICGGTGYYINALVDNVILPDVPENTLLRKTLETKTAQELYALLKEKDPERAKTIDSNNPRRLMRAIEIAEVLGKVPSLDSRPLYEPLFIGLSIEKETLRKRIHKRLICRIKEGMFEEVTHLHKKGLSWKRMEELGLEYLYCAQYFQGALSQKEMTEKLETAINKYAKRQYAWFRSNFRIHWIPYNKPLMAKKMIAAFLKENT